MTKEENNNERMTRSERLELSKVVRMRARLVRHDIDAQIAVQLAHVERQLAATYPEDDPRWAEITAQAREQIGKADAEIAKRCVELGIPESFRPGLNVWWQGRGENAFRQRRDELRRVAEAELAARALAAKNHVERTEVELLTKLTAAGLASSEAKEFLAALPTADQLMPRLLLKDLEKRHPLLPAGPAVRFEEYL